MDDASLEVVAFLEGVQAARRELHLVWNHYVRRGLKVSSACVNTGAVWGDQQLDLGLYVRGSDRRGYELCAYLQWSETGWAIHADASLDTDAEGELCYQLLRETPEKRTSDWRTALQYLKSAVGELIGFDDLVPAETASG